MTTYSKLAVQVYEADADDYNPKERALDYSIENSSQGEILDTKVQAVTGAGATVALGNYSSGGLLVIENQDGTDYVDATWEGSSGSVTQRIGAGGCLVSTDCSPTSGDLVLVASANTPMCRVILL